MADQTIEIRLILRDEMSKALAPIESQLKRIGETRVDRLHGAFDRLAPAVRVVHRELSTLTRLTLGGLVGGGVIAGLAALTKSLQDMAAQNIQLRYTAQSLGVSTKFLEDYKSALVGLGESPETAASSIKKSLETLDEFMVKGSKSSLGSFLKESIGGPQIAGQLRDIIAKQGEEAGLKFLINVAKRITDRKGRAEFLRQAGLPYSALGIDKMLSQLPKRLEMSDAEVDKMAIANMQLARHQENIKTILAGEMLPAITAITKSLSEYLQTEAGQKFSKQLGEIAGDISKAISTWIDEGGLQSALDTLVAAFGVANTVIKAIGLSWPQAIAGLVGIKFAAWLFGVGSALKALIPLVPVMLALKDVAHLWGKTPDEISAELEAQKQTPAYKQLEEKGMGGAMWDWLMRNLPRALESITPLDTAPKPQSGMGKPETEQEQRAAAATDAAERKALNDKLEELAIGTDHLADYIGQTAIGGPEGTPGESGFGFNDRTKPPLGPYNRSLMTGMPRMAPQGSSAFSAWLSTQKPSINVEDRRNEWAPGLSLDQMTRFSQQTAIERGGRYTGDYTKLGLPYIQSPEDYREGLRTTTYGNVPKSFGVDWQQSITDNPTLRALEADRPLPPMTTEWGGPSGGAPLLGGRGGDGGGIIPALAGEGGGGGGIIPALADEGGGGIIRALAGDGSGGMNGSATIDIDVGGLGQPARDPSTLFKPQSLDGAVQMQNATQPENNRLSFQ